MVYCTYFMPTLLCTSPIKRPVQYTPVCSCTLCTCIRSYVHLYLLQDYLELWTLCSVTVALTGEPALNGSVALSATAMGAIPVQKYCWYRNTVLKVCTTGNRLDLMGLTLADEGSYYVVAYTTLGVIQSEPVGLTIEGKVHYTYVCICSIVTRLTQYF